MAPDINPLYARLSCPRDSKNVYVDVGLIKTCLDLIESWGLWWWGGGSLGLTMNLKSVHVHRIATQR